MPAISVIVPAYNIEKYVDSLFNDILNQTFSDFEFILVDDGSKDKTAELIKAYCEKDTRVKYIYQENQGAGIARNNGIENAQGQYVICIDGDDMYTPDFLEKLYTRAIETDADITICSFSQLDMRTNYLSHNKGLVISALNGKEIFSRKDVEDILEVSNPGPVNKLYKRDFILKNGLKYSGTKTMNDTYFSAMALILAEKIAYVEKDLTTYRFMNSTSCTNNRGKYVKNSIIAFNEIYTELVRRDLFEEVKQTFVNRVMSNIIYESSFEMTDEGIEALKNYLQNKPFCDFSKEQIENLFNLKRHEKQYFGYRCLAILTLGLNEKINKKLASFKNRIKNLSKIL